MVSSLHPISTQIWKRPPSDWNLLITQLYNWLFRMEEEAGGTWKPKNLHEIKLFKIEESGSVFSADEVSPHLRDWPNGWSGFCHTFRRTLVKSEYWPLNVDEKSFKPGFSPPPPTTSLELFDFGDQENFTWAEGNSVKNLTMNLESGEHRLLEVRTHWGGRLPFAMEFLQTVSDGEGRMTTHTSHVYKKRRHESFTRLERELLSDYRQERHDGVWLDLIGNGSPGSLVGTILGPQDSPYSGGRFQIEITLPPTYPFMAPKFRFVTKIWHPNVDHRTGEVCVTGVGPIIILVKMLIHFQVLFPCHGDVFFYRESPGSAVVA